MASTVEDIAIAPQPDFEVMAACMRDSSQANETLADHLGRMGNIPSLDRGAQILEEIRLLGQRLDRRFEHLEQRMERLERGQRDGLESIRVRLDSL